MIEEGARWRKRKKRRVRMVEEERRKKVEEEEKEEGVKRIRGEEEGAKGGREEEEKKRTFLTAEKATGAVFFTRKRSIGSVRLIVDLFFQISKRKRKKRKTKTKRNSKIIGSENLFFWGDFFEKYFADLFGGFFSFSFAKNHKKKRF